MTTVQKRRELLHRLDNALPMGLGQATTDELEDFLARCRARETKASYFGHIVGFFRWAADPARPRIDFDPTAGLSRPRVPRGLPKPATDQDVATAMHVLTGSWLTYVALAAYAGARCCEIAAVDRRDITERSIRITGKGDRTRVLKTHSELWRVIEPLPAGPIARKVHSGGQPTANYISSATKTKLISVGLVDLTLHRFRHWYATTQLRPERYGGGGASIRTVQENLGHLSISSTAIYTQVTNEERADAIDSLPTFTAPPSR